MYVTDDEFDNLLVRQKEAILSLIQQGKYGDASAALSVVREMWIAHSYGYKADEIVQRIAKGINPVCDNWTTQEILENEG